MLLSEEQLLEKIEARQRRVDELKGVADLDARFRELTERVGELEKTNGLEARFTKLAHEVKRSSELPQSELLARIEALQRQLDRKAGPASCLALRNMPASMCTMKPMSSRTTAGFGRHCVTPFMRRLTTTGFVWRAAAAMQLRRLFGALSSELPDRPAR
jgi:hypothetical protein